MGHLKQQVTEIQDVMYYSVNNQDYDRVSGTDDREATQTISNNNQHITNAHSDTNNTNNMIGNTSTKTHNHKQVIPDTLPHSRQDTIKSYSIWSTNNNQVDKQYHREYDNMCKQAEN